MENSLEMQKKTITPKEIYVYNKKKRKQEKERSEIIIKKRKQREQITVQDGK